MNDEKEEKENNSDQIVQKESEKESKVQDTIVSVASELNEEKTLFSQKSMDAQFSEKGTENESGVYDTEVSHANDLDTLRSETTIESPKKPTTAIPIVPANGQ